MTFTTFVGFGRSCVLWCGRSCVWRGVLLIITVDVSFSWQLHFVVICLNMKMIIFLKKTKCELKKSNVILRPVYTYYYWKYGYKTFRAPLENRFLIAVKGYILHFILEKLKILRLLTKEHVFYVYSILEQSHSKEGTIKVTFFFCKKCCTITSETKFAAKKLVSPFQL